ncbi:MAG: hypothetical protein J6Y36_09310 [Treponema sp.]|nr:hypothetical protein [Treponema sp.]
MKKFVSIVVSLFLICNLYADTDSSRSANRKTALRYLQLAKHYVTESDWDSSLKACQTGIEYDNTVADLYYFCAFTLYNLGYPRYEFLPLIEVALNSDKTQWVDYNQNNARIFYADLLCTVGKPEQAVKVLDSEPMIFSSDAEFIRAKAYYEINTAESILKAEQKIESARRVYPDDARFFYLFFGYEYNLLYKENEDKTGFEKVKLSPVARKIADSFIARVPDYDREYSDLEIYASIFSEGETQVRLLKAFNARGFKNILYPVAALEAGVITEEEAVDYFMEFIDGEIDEKLLIQFYTMIKDEDLRKYFNEHLDAFNGTLIYDTSNNLEANLIVKYERGRAKEITYDADNDLSIEWFIECDFGMPVQMFVYDQSAIVKYGTYPNVNAVVFKSLDIPDEDQGMDNYEIYNIIDETYKSSPFVMIKAPEVVGTDFFIIDETTLVYGSNLFAVDEIVASANTVIRPSLEKPGAKITFSLLNGNVYSAVYSANGKVYANARFNLEGDICTIRNVDTDGDSIFEVTEKYSVGSKDIQLSDADKAAVTVNLWGTPLADADIYLKTIEFDTNLDTKIDYTETYLPHGAVKKFWDTDFNGEMDCSYTLFAKENGLVKEENAYIIRDLSNRKIWVAVTTENKIPVSVKVAEQFFDVVAGKTENIYWLEKADKSEFENAILEELAGIPQGHVIQKEFEKDSCYIRAIIFGKSIFLKKVEIDRPVKEENKDDANPSEGGKE